MSEKMNVLFFITDQQRADHLGCAGNPILKTPNLDRLASEGVRFTNAYVANPTCMPNRCAIMTGQYPNMCVRAFSVNLDSADSPTFSETLRKEDYVSKAIGKMHFNFWSNPVGETKSVEQVSRWISKKERKKLKENFPKPWNGFDEVELISGHGDLCVGHYSEWLEERAPQYANEIYKKMATILDHTYRESITPEEYYPTTYCTERAVDFLEKHARGEHGDKPFLLKVSYPDPHHPCTPPGRWGEMYNPDEIELPKSFNDKENIKKHKYIGPRSDHPQLGKMLFHTTTEEEARNFTAKTYGMVSMIDDSVGQILAALEKLGMADNTMIVYTSDHGDMMGDHGMILKGFMSFNGITNVPLIWKVPGITPKGAVSDSLVSAVDLAPTILNLSNINKEKIPLDMQGIDIIPILKDPSVKLRDSCLIEIDEADIRMKDQSLQNNPLSKLFYNSALRVKSVVTERYTLTVYNNLPGYGDLFDRKNDPDELNNLWYSNPELRLELLDKLVHEIISAQSLYPKKQGSGG
ncbi:MAG: sulfatase [Candidatus Hodarchaeota archaeon]